MTEKSHKGLVQREITVRRGGKTFKQMRWVKPGEDEPAPKKGKKIDSKEKGSFNIGEAISFMGNNLRIMKVSESEKTVKLSDGKVYTFEAINKGKKPEDKPKKEPSIKDLKVSEKKLEKKYPDKTIITKENIDETLKPGSTVWVIDTPGTILANNNNQIINFRDDKGNEKPLTVSFLLEVDGLKTRTKDKNDIKREKQQEKKINAAEKIISDREKRFSKVYKPKQIGAESTIKSSKIGDKIEVTSNEFSEIENITPEGITIGGFLYDHDVVDELIIGEGKSLVTGEKVSSNYNFTNDKKQDKKISETINKLDNLMLDGKSLNDAVKEVISGKKGSLKLNVNESVFDEKSTKIINDTLNRVDEFISPKYKESGLEINLEKNTTGRSYAHPETNTISLSSGYGMNSALMHEIGHIMEDNHGDNREVIDDFLRSRTNNLSDQEKMSDLFPGIGYQDNEIACKDNFVNPYIGKIYNKSVKTGEINTKDINGTEILSMGVEKFSGEKSMRNFYHQDKEHFALTLSVMAGDFL